MVVLVTLFFASMAGLIAALLQPGWSDLVLVAGPAAIASLFLLIAALVRGKRPPAVPTGPVRAPSPFRFGARRAAAPTPNWIVVDGSNVLHWKDGKPELDTLREVLGHLTALGYSPGVVFDANAGYLISDRYQHDHALGKLLGLPDDRVMVVANGTPADPMILAAARDLGARIVTNDRYRDWRDSHPEVGDPGHLIRGGYRAGQLWLDLEAAAITKP